MTSPNASPAATCGNWKIATLRVASNRRPARLEGPNSAIWRLRLATGGRWQVQRRRMPNAPGEEGEADAGSADAVEWVERQQVANGLQSRLHRAVVDTGNARCVTDRRGAKQRIQSSHGPRMLHDAFEFLDIEQRSIDRALGEQIDETAIVVCDDNGHIGHSAQTQAHECCRQRSVEVVDPRRHPDPAGAGVEVFHLGA